MDNIKTIDQLEEACLQNYSKALITLSVNELHALETERRTLWDMCDNALETGYWQGEARTLLFDAKEWLRDSRRTIASTMFSLQGVTA